MRRRIEGVREERLASKKKTTRELASTPHLFAERRPLGGDFLCIPRHVSARRTYFTAARLDDSVISGDANFVAADADGLTFAVICSSAFMACQRMVGGQIKSDLRFSNTLVWNTLPLPALGEEERNRLIAAGERILEARALHPERSLAEHYNPLVMDPALVKAHEALDRVTDPILGMPKGASEKDRQTRLFELYAEEH